jgi:hypothetical protein
MRASMSATGSVNLIVSFSSSHPFAPRSAENLQRLLKTRRWSLVVRRWHTATLQTTQLITFIIPDVAVHSS